MNWIDIQKLLNELEEKYNSLYLLNDYILKEENYDIDNMKMARYIFFLMKQIKKNLSILPKNIEEVRSICITYGNDTKRLEEKLKSILKGIDELNDSSLLEEINIITLKTNLKGETKARILNGKEAIETRENYGLELR